MKLPIGTYSLYNQFENCPHKAQHLYVLKDLPRVETPEMKWGNDVHSALEHRIAAGTVLPGTMQNAEPLAQNIYAVKEHFPVHVEYKLAMNATGRPVDYWADDCWFRGKIDVAVIAHDAGWICDWKTGKPREEPLELQTGALLLKVHYPTLNTIVANYFWLKEGRSGPRYTCNDHGRTFAKLQALRAEMEGYAAAGGEWPKRKNPLCGWCQVLSCENNTSQGRK